MRCPHYYFLSAATLLVHAFLRRQPGRGNQLAHYQSRTPARLPPSLPPIINLIKRVPWQDRQIMKAKAGALLMSLPQDNSSLYTHEMQPREIGSQDCLSEMQIKEPGAGRRRRDRLPTRGNRSKPEPISRGPLSPQSTFGLHSSFSHPSFPTYLLRDTRHRKKKEGQRGIVLPPAWKIHSRKDSRREDRRPRRDRGCVSRLPSLAGAQGLGTCG